MALVSEICNFLKTEGFHYLDSWVSECVSYYKSNNPSISTAKLKEEVRQQWLLLNLKDIKVPAFPPNLKSQTKVILPGKYAVQVESMIDSGQSCYSQWQTLKKCNLENVACTTKPKEDENIARRCFTMKISDGVQDLSAMEYELIPGLKLCDPDLPPGFKIVIKGPVTCRRGMILLKPENVKVCGGEVDCLAESNSLQIILASALGLDVSNDEECSSTGNNILTANENEELLSGMDEEILMNVPIAENDNATQPPTTIFNHEPHTSNQPDTFTIDDDPFGNEDDVLFNIPETDYGGSSHIESAPSTTNGSGKSRENIRKKQLPISQFFTRETPSKTSNNKNTGIAIPQTSGLASPKSVPSAPFVYLLQIVGATLKADSDFKVKAVIITLKSKISVKNDVFTLKAKICDGSLSMDVLFSTEILEHFLGFSPLEMAAMVKEKATNPNIAERLKTAFACMQNKLISLNAILSIRFFLDKRIPLVLSLEEVTVEHLSALRARQ